MKPLKKLVSPVVKQLNNGVATNYENVIQLTPSEFNSATLDVVQSIVMAILMNANRLNQLKTAKQLGISRATLRTKLEKAFGDLYIGHRE